MVPTRFHLSRRFAIPSALASASLVLAAAGCADMPSACETNGTCAPTTAGIADGSSAESADAGDAAPASDAAVAPTSDAQSAPSSADVSSPSANFDAALPDAGAPTTQDAAGQASDASSAASPEAAAPSPCDSSQDPKNAPCLLADAYGVFVSAAGRAGADGTLADPLPTITGGLAKAAASGKTRVFVCSGNYSEQVSLGANQGPVSVYGGLSCATGWSWVRAATSVTAPSSAGYALDIEGASSPVTLEDLSFSAPDAQGQDSTGSARSSVAAFIASSSHVNLVRVSLTAGRGSGGGAGTDGVLSPNYPVIAAVAPAGAPAIDSSFGGAAGANNHCGDLSSSTGGNGGIADWNPGIYNFPGTAGAASPAPFLLAAPFDGAAASSASGDPGANGSPAKAPVPPSGYGMLAARAWQAAPGPSGGAGLPGQGGGGGSGQALDLEGGGGGAGGCGGAGGAGGHGGGGSIALLSDASTVTLSSCALATAAGGGGGQGGAGQPGQGGGAGGAYPYSYWGGAGGNGAGGGGGAGGPGGISVAIVSQQGMPAFDVLTTFSLGAAGQGGAGGAGGSHGSGALPTGNDGLAGPAGLPGLSASTLAL